MADVVVVGAGPAGLAAAARLAKLRHDVVVVDRDERPGGSLKQVHQGGYSWTAGETSTTLPAVWRDLFRKSGRPLERHVELTMRAVARRHVFEDGSSIDLPTGSRAAQIAAVDAGLGAGSGRRWADFLDAQAGVWERLRAEVLDRPDGGARLLGDRRLARQLGATRPLQRVLADALDDGRLRAIAAHGSISRSTDAGGVPALAAVECYVERTFGVWETARGLAELGDALVERLAERGVELRLGCTVDDVTRDSCGRITGVGLHSGESLPAAVVVSSETEGTSGARDRRVVTHLGLEGPVPDMPSEVVLHGDPTLVVTTRGTPPEGGSAWSIRHHATFDVDVIDLLAQRGLDVREYVVTRVDRVPEPEAPRGGEPAGRRLLGARVPLANVAMPLEVEPGHLRAGPAVRIGSPLPYGVWGAANVAAAVGKSVR